MKDQNMGSENLLLYSRYMQEKRMNALVSAGDTERLESMLMLSGKKQRGHLSKNPYRQQLYSVIIGIAVITRAAMDGGLDEETSYALSDTYIQKADICDTEEQLWKVYADAALAFASQVKEAKKDTGISDTIQLSMDYILHHLHSDITLKEIADNAGLSETYFSALFKKETGENVSEFIQKSRVKDAQSLLQYSDYSLMEIGKYLGFCSQSHFSKTFRRFTGMTPGQYRKEYFKRKW